MKSQATASPQQAVCESRQSCSGSSKKRTRDGSPQRYCVVKIIVATVYAHARSLPLLSRMSSSDVLRPVYFWNCSCAASVQKQYFKLEWFHLHPIFVSCLALLLGLDLKHPGALCRGMTRILLNVPQPYPGLCIYHQACLRFRRSKVCTFRVRRIPQPHAVFLNSSLDDGRTYCIDHTYACSAIILTLLKGRHFLFESGRIEVPPYL